MRTRVSSVALAASAVLFLGGCADSPDAAEPSIGASATSATTTTTTATSVEPAPEPSTSDAPPPVETTEDLVPLAEVEYQRNESYYFSSPDGNFQCGIVRLPNRTEAGCEGITDPVPPQPDDCMVNWGHGIRVQDTGEGAFLCSGGPVYLSPDGASPALSAGSELSELGYTCTATAADVTCTNDTTGHGFRIAPDSNETF